MGLLDKLQRANNKQKLVVTISVVLSSLILFEYGLVSLPLLLVVLGIPTYILYKIWADKIENEKHTTTEMGRIEKRGPKIVRKVIGIPLKIAGIINFIIFGLWGLILLVGIVNEVAGFLGVVIGFMLLPVMFVAAPWYAIVAWGNWLPLIVCYGGGILTAILYGLGLIIAGNGD